MAKKKKSVAKKKTTKRKAKKKKAVKKKFSKKKNTKKKKPSIKILDQKEIQETFDFLADDNELGESDEFDDGPFGQDFEEDQNDDEDDINNLF